MTSYQPWYERAFAAEYVELYRHRSPEQGRGQVGQMLSAGLIEPGQIALDLCCGAGRHLLPMREAGLSAWGLDLSAQLLTAGNLGGVAVRGDAITLPFADGVFDRVLNLFSSFGYFPDDQADLDVLRGVRRVLRPGGRLVIDHMNASHVIDNLVPESKETRDGLVLTQKRRYDPASRRVIKDIEYTPAGGKPRRWHESVRLFTPAEIDTLIETAGMRTIARYGELDARPFEEQTSIRQVVVAERPAA